MIKKMFREVFQMFRGMEYVYEVWQAQSFSAAAKKLYISQPALSNGIKRVEEKIGAPLFDRSSSPIRLTEVGQEYIHAVEQIHSIEENFSRFLADTQELRTGSIAVGSGAMMTAYLLPGIIAAYKEKYPYVEVKVTEGSNAQLRSMLADGTLDVVLENTQLPESLFDRQLYSIDHMILAVPCSWPVNEELRAWQLSVENICSGNFLWPRYPAVPLQSFRDSAFLLMSPDDENYRRAVSLCERNGFTPHTILTLSQQLTAYHMVCAGLGAAFISDTLVRCTQPNPGIVYYKLEGAEAEREVCFYTKKNRYIPRCLQAFLQCAGQYGPKSSSEEKK